MKEEEFHRSLGDACYCQHLSFGPVYYFWVGYEHGLKNYHDGKFRPDSDNPEMEEDKHHRYMFGDDLESLGYRAGFAGLTAKKALAVGKKGIYSAGLNGNFHRVGDHHGALEGALVKMGVIYRGHGKWRLPEGAKIKHAPVGEIKSYYRSDGGNWILQLADGSKWIVWSEDIAPLWCWDEFVSYFSR